MSVIIHTRDNPNITQDALDDAKQKLANVIATADLFVTVDNEIYPVEGATDLGQGQLQCPPGWMTVSSGCGEWDNVCSVLVFVVHSVDDSELWMWWVGKRV